MHRVQVLCRSKSLRWALHAWVVGLELHVFRHHDLFTVDLVRRFKCSFGAHLCPSQSLLSSPTDLVFRLILLRKLVLSCMELMLNTWEIASIVLYKVTACDRFSDWCTVRLLTGQNVLLGVVLNSDVVILMSWDSLVECRVVKGCRQRSHDLTIIYHRLLLLLVRHLSGSCESFKALVIILFVVIELLESQWFRCLFNHSRSQRSHSFSIVALRCHWIAINAWPLAPNELICMPLDRVQLSVIRRVLLDELERSSWSYVACPIRAKLRLNATRTVSFAIFIHILGSWSFLTRC